MNNEEVATNFWAEYQLEDQGAWFRGGFFGPSEELAKQEARSWWLYGRVVAVRIIAETQKVSLYRVKNSRNGSSE